MLMNEDLRPPKEPKHFVALGDRETKTPGITTLPHQEDVALPAEQIDEQKLEAEFGPPPNMSAHELAEPEKKSGITKLLPSAIIRRHPRRLQLILAGVSLAIVTAAGATSYVILHTYNPPVIHTPIPVYKKPQPTTVANTLTGRQVDPSVNKRPVTAVMIENSLDARPQSGLDQAGIVYEAIAEGGITRFLALYQDTEPTYMGPVRSARPYYVQWALGYDAPYAHVGGSPEALQDIIAWHVKDLNQFYNGNAYERISSRYPPHNVYTSIAQLSSLEKSKGYTSSTFTGFARKAKETPSTSPNATSISMTFSSYYYNTHYDYDAKTNTYKRSEGGATHMELTKDGKLVQIAPKVLVALVMSYSLESDGYHSDYQAIGSGKAYVFQDGTVVTGTWHKTSRSASLSLTGADGKDIPLEAGQTWISALAGTSDVTYTGPKPASTSKTT